MDASATGLDGFVAGLRRLGLEATGEAGVVTFTVDAIDGSSAGGAVATGVDVEELMGWPAVPPHWVHLPSDLVLPRSNTRPSPAPGMSEHSRQVSGWGNASEPAQAWVAHVRAVVGEAE